MHLSTISHVSWFTKNVIVVLKMHWLHVKSASEIGRVNNPFKSDRQSTKPPLSKTIAS